MTIFEFEDYRKIVANKADQISRGQRGELRRVAQAAKVFPSYLSQVLKGKRDFTLEQALSVADYFGFKGHERKYFLLLVQKSRAGSTRLKEEFENEISELLEESYSLSKRLPNQKELDLEQCAMFLSHWSYSATCVLIAIEKYQNEKSLGKRLGLDSEQLNSLLSFLIKIGMLVKKGSRLEIGPKHTHFGSDHPMISKHHANWRLRAIEKHPRINSAKELAYSSVMALSEEDALKIRKLLPDLIQQVRKVSDPSPSETAYCLNLDWFEV